MAGLELYSFLQYVLSLKSAICLYFAAKLTILQMHIESSPFSRAPYILDSSAAFCSGSGNLHPLELVYCCKQEWRVVTAWLVNLSCYVVTAQLFTRYYTTISTQDSKIILSSKSLRDLCLVPQSLAHQQLELGLSNHMETMCTK